MKLAVMENLSRAVANTYLMMAVEQGFFAAKIKHDTEIASASKLIMKSGLVKVYYLRLNLAIPPVVVLK